MFKKIFILMLIVFFLQGINVKAKEKNISFIENDLKNSSLFKEKINNNHKININTNKDNILIKEEYDNKTITIQFDYNDNYLEFSSSEEKEILSEKTPWIEEINKILLKKNNYDDKTIKEFDISKYKYYQNGIEGVKNTYIKDGNELHYYFYYKVNLEKIDLNNQEKEKQLEQENDNINDKNIINNNKMEQIEEENNNKNKNMNYTILIEIFCMLIAVLMLFISSATKN